eukprot:COSAG05_NODE_532_length_8897_cov_18.622301_8_plen_58_part_00
MHRPGNWAEWRRKMGGRGGGASGEKGGRRGEGTILFSGSVVSAELTIKLLREGHQLL